MKMRGAALQEFIDSLAVAFDDATGGPEIVAVTNKLLAALRRPGKAGLERPARLAVCSNVPIALRFARDVSPNLARLANAKPAVAHAPLCSPTPTPTPCARLAAGSGGTTACCKAGE